jgi:hypothetical protein
MMAARVVYSEEGLVASIDLVIAAKELRKWGSRKFMERRPLKLYHLHMFSSSCV